jgi:PhzF family phenazine biosynthesis protein
MSKLNYYVVDVFSHQRYKGNQLSVVYCDRDLTLDQYHEISREFGYSETSFVTYSTKENALKVRSFTPADFEVIGAGHNLLGAVCLALLKNWDIFKNQQGGQSVIIGDMRIPVNVTEKDGLPYVAMKQRPAKVIRSVDPNIIAKAVGLGIDDLILNDWEISVVETEVGHLMVPVKDSRNLQKAVPDKSLLKAASRKYGFEGCYLFTTDQPDNELLAETRFFNPGIGIDEDPATGTAAGPLTGYLEKLGYIKQDKNYVILQGTAVKHPSYIHVNVSGDGIWVSGSSVIVMEGILYL